MIHFLLIVLLNYAYYYYLEARGDRRKLAWIVLANLANLFLFKYYGFFRTILQDLSFSVEGMETLESILPLAISFYTFQLIAFQVDVHRGTFSQKVNLPDFLLFIFFFPQLIAGPILRAKDFLQRISIPKVPRILFSEIGIVWILIGVIKKVLIADQISPLIDPIYSDPQKYSIGGHWFAFYGFAFQIYCDFSGYTDIARGCALLLGYKLPPNFLAPYFAGSLREFWRRWHITLSTWLRDYLYIPLGGNRRGTTRTSLNLCITMLLGGIWHGANYTFVIWGLWHGFLLWMERLWENTKFGKLNIPKWVRIPIVFHLVCIGWVFFRADSLQLALVFLKGMAVGIGETPKYPWGFSILILSFIAVHVIEYGKMNPTKRRILFRILLPVAACVVGFITAGSVSGERSFIYFQF
ncbi:MBOAT family O-acyltransferase [Leptospira perolatii]|uniref:MBOAT family O-acyltransferase n=1 Tax=Leptospira perolatii TaxID=2023191 RepID=UPI001FAFF728|nr:MBOAT family O-acyltransferase [Leptospira perolatii]